MQNTRISALLVTGMSLATALLVFFDASNKKTFLGGNFGFFPLLLTTGLAVYFSLPIVKRYWKEKDGITAISIPVLLALPFLFEVRTPEDEGLFAFIAAVTSAVLMSMYAFTKK